MLAVRKCQLVPFSCECRECQENLCREVIHKGETFIKDTTTGKRYALTCIISAVNQNQNCWSEAVATRISKLMEAL